MQISPVPSDNIGVLVSLVDRVGVPALIAAMMGWFLYKALWPFLTKQVEEANTERRLLLSELRGVLAQHTAASQQLVYGMEKLQDGVDDLRDKKRTSHDH